MLSDLGILTWFQQEKKKNKILIDRRMVCSIALAKFDFYRFAPNTI